MNINIITLGCSKNTVDSEKLAGALRTAGHIVYFDRTRNDCPVAIVNTCGFIGDAKEESIGVLLAQIAAKKRVRTARHIIAVGCLVERYKEELATEMPEIDGWYGTKEQDAILDKIKEISKNIGQSESSESSLIPSIRQLSTPRHYAYLKISEGCDRRCSYCAIPLIRGSHTSRPIEELVDEAKQLVLQGVKELIIIAQDTTYYGVDLYHRRALPQLLEALATQSGAQWIRLHYTYPASFPLEVLDVMARYDNICHYIDIPLQHINSRILHSMQRGIDREGTLALIDTIRHKLPDVAIRTTLIVGYPGETESDFNELLQFVKQARFDRMGCFAYSAEEGTAAEALEDTVDDDEKQRRVSVLMEAQEQISLQHNQQRVGRKCRVLIDRREADYWIGRTEYDSPEVDDEVLISCASMPDVKQGDFVVVEITAALENDLFAQPIDK
ncbi:MAG: 30S ribosomal protein S12 methylthiotransferase RimO [Bacteroidales bacterium]|nr:30S ribosomal protein S12 methylthiotransferase RimO [Bacteroidales bacterium]